MHRPDKTSDNPFLHGWLEGRRMLIETLMAIPEYWEIRDALEAELNKDKRTARNLHIRVKVH